MDWVLAQTLDRKRLQLEADEIEYAEKLARARQKEIVMRKAANARVRKKLVKRYKTSYYIADKYHPLESCVRQLERYQYRDRRFCFPTR